MPTDPSPESKTRVRQLITELRASVSASQADTASTAIWEMFRARPEFSNALNVAAFSAVRNELPTRCLLTGILESRKPLFLPRTDPETHRITFHLVSDLSQLTPGPFGIPEPPLTEPLPPDSLRLVLVPGLAFDHRGNRIGFGGGFYDRFLSTLSPTCLTVGVGYSFQVLDQVPSTALDIPVKALLTEKGFHLAIP